MREDQANPQAKRKWKRGFRLVLWTYAALCTVLVSACIALWLWSVLFPSRTSPASGGGQAVFMTTYGAYMAAEYPQRGNQFKSMAEALCEYVEETPIPETDLFRYLGRPDKFYSTNVLVSVPGQPLATNTIVLFAYLFEQPGTTNKGSAVAMVEDAKVQQITLRERWEMSGIDFQPFPRAGVLNMEPK